jgi:hypothetical protein
MIPRLIVRRECWTLSPAGKLLVLMSLLGLSAVLLYTVYPFLAINVPVPGDFIVLEGWTTGHAGVLKQTASEFQHGHYHHVLILQESNSEDVAGLYASCADAAEILKDYGVPREAIIEVAYPAAERDRTYHAALAARDWFIRNKLLSHSFDVITIGPHARRSRLMYQRVFGKTVDVGVIAFSDASYDPTHWWRTSEGFRQVQGEAIAYIYAGLYYASIS